MTRKRYETPEQVLAFIISLLEGQPSTTGTAAALEALFVDGPISAPHYVVAYQQLPPDEQATLRPALLDDLQWLVNRSTSRRTWTLPPVTEAVVQSKGRLVHGIVPDPSRPPDVQEITSAAHRAFLLLAHSVGLGNLRRCTAPDCSRVYIQFHKRRYCSPPCQRRHYMQQRRANDRAKRLRQQLRLQRQRQQRKRA